MPTQNRYQTASSGVGTNTRKRAKDGDLRRANEKSPAIAATGTTGFFPVKFKSKQFFELQYANADNPYLKMWEDLKPAYLNYCKLCGIRPKALSESNMLENITKAYNHLKTVILKEQKEAEINIDCDYNPDDETTGEYFFVIHRVFRMSHELFAFPLVLFSNMEECKNPLLPYMERFCCWFLRKMGFSDWECGERLELSVEYLHHWAAETAEEDSESAEAMLKEHFSYTCGKAQKWLTRIRTAKMFTIKHVRELKRKRYKDEFTEFIRKWMLEGYDFFISKECQPVQNFAYRADPDQTSEEYDEQLNYGTPVSVSDLFSIVWDEEDSMTEMFIEDLNQISNEFGSDEPTEFYFITPRTTKKFQTSDWFTNVKDWLNQGFKYIITYNDNCKKLRNNNEQHDRAANIDLQTLPGTSRVQMRTR